MFVFAIRAFFAGYIRIEYECWYCLVVRNFFKLFSIQTLLELNSFSLSLWLTLFLSFSCPSLLLFLSLCLFLSLSFYSFNCIQNFLIFLKIYEIKLYRSIRSKYHTELAIWLCWQSLIICSFFQRIYYIIYYNFEKLVLFSSNNDQIVQNNYISCHAFRTWYTTYDY